jgi:hypothetical protein
MMGIETASARPKGGFLGDNQIIVVYAVAGGSK